LPSQKAIQAETFAYLRKNIGLNYWKN